MTTIQLSITMGVATMLTVGAGRFFRDAGDRGAVVTSQAALVAGFREAQSAARALGGPVALVVSGDSIVASTILALDTLVLFRRPGPSDAGVTLTPSEHVIQFEKSGATTRLANVTLHVSKGDVARTIVLSRLGRVRLD